MWPIYVWNNLFKTIWISHLIIAIAITISKVHTFISSCETDSLYIAFSSISSLSCCFYERFFAIDWLFVHLCMHKINLLPCVSMALAKEGSPTIILIKSCGGLFLWKRVWGFVWSVPVGHFRAHKLLELFITINKRDFMLYFFS